MKKNHDFKPHSFTKLAKKKAKPFMRIDITSSLESLHLEEVVKYPHSSLHVIMDHQVEKIDDGPLGFGDQLCQIDYITESIRILRLAFNNSS